MLLNVQRFQIRIKMPCQVREKISISPVIAGIAFVLRDLSTGEIFFISPLSLPHLSHHHAAFRGKVSVSAVTS